MRPPTPSPDLSGFPTRWLTIPEVATVLDLRITQVHRLVREGELLAGRLDGVLKVPAELVTTDPQVAKHITGIVTLLRDAGLSSDEALRWLLTPDETYRGEAAMTPAAALHGHKAREVKRRAQALAV